jgi:DedD protein
MGLLSLFQRHQRQPRQDDAPLEPSPVEPDAVAAARTRARRRLIGAAVLLGIGVVGFPLLFETQPRPVPVDIPIEIPRKDGAPPLVPPAASPALSAASAAVVLPDAEVPAAPEAAPRRPAEITERAADAGREVTAAAPATPPAPAPAMAAAKPAASAPRAAASAPRAAASAPRAAASAARPAADGEAARAQALLNGQAAAASAAGARMVVQVGAYTEPAKLKEARLKVEKLGFKTYTQVVEVDGAKRTRVRIGPFATKAEADKAAARIKASGLPAAILAL